MNAIQIFQSNFGVGKVWTLNFLIDFLREEHFNYYKRHIPYTPSFYCLKIEIYFIAFTNLSLLLS